MAFSMLNYLANQIFWGFVTWGFKLGGQTWGSNN